MPFPGDIVSEAMLTKDIRDRYIIEKNGTRLGCIKDEYIPADAPGNPFPPEDWIVNNVVCLSNKKYALENYKDELINYYYIRTRVASTFIDEEARNPDSWISRWRDVALDPERIIVDEEGFTLNPPQFMKWVFVKTSQWLMPITTYTCIDFLTGTYKFCPSSLKRTNNIKKVLPTIYQEKLFCKNNPPSLCYKADLIRSNQKTKPVKIYLHGTLDPIKWHFGLWNHVLSGTSLSDQDEIKFWESWLGYSMPAKSEIEDIFKDCSVRQNKRGGNCDRCSDKQFQKVHESIKALSELYWEKVVTFWESGSTKEICVVPLRGRYDITVRSTEKKIFTLEGRKMVRYPLLIMKGWSYDYDNTDSEAALHLNVVSFYFKPKNVLITSPGCQFPLELKNVARS